MKFLPRVQSSFRAGGLGPSRLQPGPGSVRQQLSTSHQNIPSRVEQWGVRRQHWVEGLPGCPVPPPWDSGSTFSSGKCDRHFPVPKLVICFAFTLVHRGIAQWHPSGGQVRKADEGSSRVRDGKGDGSWECGDHDGKGQCLLAVASCSKWECGPLWLVSNI